jgi:hypothetical protein
MRGRLQLGFVAAAGILASMFLFGLVVVLLLSYPLAGALWIISPVAYVLLGVIGVLLILDVFPEFTVTSKHLPTGRIPFVGAFLFGLFFGILILPCNAAPIAILLALSTSTSDLFVNMLWSRNGHAPRCHLGSLRIPGKKGNRISGPAQTGHQPRNWKSDAGSGSLLSHNRLPEFMI